MEIGHYGAGPVESFNGIQREVVCLRQKLPPDVESWNLQNLQLFSGISPFCSSYLRTNFSDKAAG